VEVTDAAAANGREEREEGDGNEGGGGRLGSRWIFFFNLLLRLFQITCNF